jgi:hypothetical protein
MGSVESTERMKKIKQLGMSMLETAVILPTILLFTVGSIDVANYFRSYSAVREGVQAGLRCLYPSDAACVAVNAPKSIAQNNVYIPPIFSKYFDYDGVEKKLLLPNYEYTPIRAKTLSQVSYNTLSQVDTHYRAERRAYDATGVAKVFSIEYPTLGNGSVGNGRAAGIGDQGILLNLYKNQGQQTPQSRSCNSLVTSFSNSSTITENQIYDRFYFNVPTNPFSSLEGQAAIDANEIDDCIAYRNGKALNRAQARSRCRASDVRSYARVFFKLKGSTLGSVGAAGHLDLFLEYRSSDGNWHGASRNSPGSAQSSAEASLGGQDFSTGMDDFYPRGFTGSEAMIRRGGATLRGYTNSPAQSHFPDDNEGIEIGFKQNGSLESNYNNHGNIYVPWGSMVRISVRLRKPEGAITCGDGKSIGWRIDLAKSTVRIGEPKIIQERTSCNNKLSRHLCTNDPQSCVISPANFSNQLLTQTTSHKKFNVACNLSSATVIETRQPTSCLSNPPSLTSLGILQNGQQDWEVVALPNNDCIEHVVSNCPSNFGVSDVATQNQNGAFTIRNSSSAASACPAQNPIAGSEEWSEAIQTVYSSPIPLDKQDCTFDSTAPIAQSLLPSSVTPYKKLILPSATRKGSSQIDTSTVDPIELKKQSQYACGLVTVDQRNFREDSRESFTDQEWQRLISSSFSGAHRQLGCNSSEILKQEARSIGLDPKSYFAVTKAQSAGDQEYQVSSIDSCMQVRVDQSLTTSNMRSLVPGSPFDQNDIPQGCIVPDGNGGVRNICIFIPAGIRKLEDTGSYGLDQNMAEAIASDTVKTFLPSGKNDSSCLTSPHKDCIAVSMEPKEIDENKLLTEPLTMKASVLQPLLVLGNKPIEISYEASRQWEGR